MDIQTIVNDTDLFGNTGEITTKEILKRYGEMGKSANYAPGAQTPPQHHGSVGGGSRTGAPVPTRVDTDQTQIHAWQKESSVRHVGQNGAPSFPPPVNQNTPPMMQSEFANRNSPYHQRGGSSENAGNAGTPNRHSQRPWGRQQPNQGPGQNGFTG